MNRRMERVNSLLMRNISNILSTHINDPRLSALITVTKVETSPDMSSAKVFVSVMEDQSSKAHIAETLNLASGFVRRSLIGKLSLRKIPALDFRIDSSIETSAKMSKLIDNLIDHDENYAAS